MAKKSKKKGRVGRPPGHKAHKKKGGTVKGSPGRPRKDATGRTAQIAAQREKLDEAVVLAARCDEITSEQAEITEQIAQLMEQQRELNDEAAQIEKDLEGVLPNSDAIPAAATITATATATATAIASDADNGDANGGKSIPAQARKILADVTNPGIRYPNGDLKGMLLAQDLEPGDNRSLAQIVNNVMSTHPQFAKVEGERGMWLRLPDGDDTPSPDTSNEDFTDSTDSTDGYQEEGLENDIDNMHEVNIGGDSGDEFSEEDEASGRQVVETQQLTS